ncbi:DEAD/DEAH box helicase [Bryobacter aggregatus]|uniref:DEAD/DEAH box helicase n=1 Tax=Bryobacter aggregatus TaxID=360054 RepID=UPI0004E0C853|nr:DEAD/DEAH box helicase [Bryobacter aggregatus]
MSAHLRAKLIPSLEHWFFDRFPEFSEVQKLALPHTLAGENTLILAPTGSGKTLAAFLSALSTLGELAAQDQLENATHVVYVSPLRSLNRDIERNLRGPLAALNASLPASQQIRLETRTGDTSLHDRQRMARNKPHLLLTTPESLSSLMSQTQWRDGFRRCCCVVVDEIHSFCESKRGALLAITLERLEAKRDLPLQRIGLSATAAPVEAVVNLLAGDRPCAVVAANTKKVYRLEIAPIPADTHLPAGGFNPYRIAHVVADLVLQANCSLIFTATRSAAERLGLALKVLLPELDDEIEVHHASLDRERRLWVEDQLSEGTLRAVVCSTSLEMGVDFSGVDQVLLIGAPRGVSRAVQRLGRGGHRVGGVAAGALVPLSLPDILECIAIRSAVKAGRLDPLRPPRAPLDVLAQALLGLGVERPWDCEEAFALLRRAGPYRELARSDFDAVLTYLAGGGKVLGSSGDYGKLIVTRGKFQVASRKVARTYYQNIGTISDDYSVRVVTQKQRRLGDVEEGFLATLQPGEGFVIAGQSVVVKSFHANVAVVAPAQGERVQTPRWLGGKMSLTARLAQEELVLRRALRKAYESGGMAACAKLLQKDWGTSLEIAQRVAAYVERQYHASPLPIDDPISLERVPDGRSVLYLFHSVAGRSVNRSLIWTVSHRLGENFGSIVGNFDDHTFLFRFSAKRAPSLERLREAFHPEGFQADLVAALSKTELLGAKFRPICETGQLLPRRNSSLPLSQRRAASWSGNLLFQTFRRYEPDHPLLREAVREVLEDDLDAEAAALEAAHLHATAWEVVDLERPSPFAIPLFAAFNRETLIAQDPDKALDEVVSALYDTWK